MISSNWKKILNYQIRNIKTTPKSLQMIRLAHKKKQQMQALRKILIGWKEWMIKYSEALIDN